MRRRLHSQRGVAYLSLIILVAVIALVGALGVKMGAALQRSAAEQELLFIGAQFADALQSYASATPAGQPPQPPSLKELLKDPRFPTVRRHLRKLFVDPMTGKAEWGIVYASGTTGVLGVYSLSQAKPVKIGNFATRFKSFEGKEHLSDWKFMPELATATLPAADGLSNGVPAAPPATSQPPLVPPAASQPPLAAPASGQALPVPEAAAMPSPAVPEAASMPSPPAPQPVPLAAPPAPEDPPASEPESQEP